MSRSLTSAPALRRPAALLAALLVLAAVTLAGVVGLVGAAAPASAACSCGPADTEADARAARYVFTGTVEKASPRGRSWVQEVSVDRVYKGTVSESALEVVTESRVEDPCGLGRLTPGSEYVFFARVDDERVAAPGCGGTAPVRAGLVRAVEEMYGEGAPPSIDPGDVEAVIEPVGADAPADFTRTAAPGLAMVLVGLLGLVLARWAGRRA
ncbi:hypothetical protein GHK92_14870 [Nocardioides sp. dk4132]|uniref:hypothetical protein n=1 Tax=unclassified Nocardioides TaxID=2615069 RepID=UPI001295C669|nr:MULTISPECIES: hypothetical protein [unclassified Nocardioides]MQW77161.1 hypothetical protein [Nocardioides sp. dk4132]QGA06045.1 hypothetical protein GFH29_00490 [Nocardioides sp. dk884]